jgi:hypothetical protein
MLLTSSGGNGALGAAKFFRKSPVGFGSQQLLFRD